MNSSDPLGFDFNPSAVAIQTPTSLPRRPLLVRVPNTDHDYILHIDNSSLERLDVCPRSAEYYLVARRQGISGAALAFGGALHLGLEHYYKTGDMSTGIDLAVERYSPTILRPDEWRTTEFLRSTLSLYYKHYHGNDFKVLSHDETPLVELPFSLPLGEFDVEDTIQYTYRELLGEGNDENVYIRKLHVLWSGKIDLITSHVGEPCITDHKTTSIEGPSFYDQFYLSQPVHGYAWAAEAIIGQPIRHFMLNAIIMRKPTRTGVSNNFIRKLYSISSFNKDEFTRDVTTKIEQFLHNLLAGYFPKNPCACQGKYGCCQYFNVCQMDGPGRQIMLASDLYENVTWSPLSDH